MKKYVIYGAGFWTCKIAKDFPRVMKYVAYIIDNDPDKQNNKPKELCGVKVCSLQHAVIDDNYTYLVSEKYSDDMRKQLIDRGVNEYNIFVLQEYLIKILYETYNVYFEEDNIYMPNAIVEKETLYVICPYGIGDTLFVASMVGEYNRLYAQKEKICLIVKENHAPIPDWFDSISEKMVSSEIVSVLAYICVAEQRWKGNNFLYGHFKKNAKGELDKNYSLFRGNMLDKYRELVFEINEYVHMEQIHIAAENNNICANLEKSIILMPYAVSTIMLPFSIWEYIAEKLLYDGWHVFTNTKDETENPIKGTERISGDINYIANICEKAYSVLSIRSGICDVLAMTNTKLVVINLDMRLAEEWNVRYISNREGLENVYVDLNIDEHIIANELLDIMFETKDEKELYGIKVLK